MTLRRRRTDPARHTAPPIEPPAIPAAGSGPGARVSDRRPSPPTTVDVGALRVSLPHGTSARLRPADAGGGTFPARELVLCHGEITVRMAVFAAPTSHGALDGLRADHAAAPVPSPISTGRYGPEFRSADRRIIGIAGARWYLRVVVTPATDDSAAPSPALDTILAGTRVARGTQAMPAGAPLPLVDTTRPDTETTRRVTLSDLRPQGPTEAGTATLERRPAIYEQVGVFTGSLSRNLSTWG